MLLFSDCSSKDKFAKFIILQQLLSVLCELVRFVKDFFGENYRRRKDSESEKSEQNQSLILANEEDFEKHFTFKLCTNDRCIA